MSLEGILHARYMDASSFRGNATYGNSVFTNGCGALAEGGGAPARDVSRSQNYFTADSRLYLDGVGIAGLVETSNNNKQAINRAVHFMNNDYVLLGNRVYVYDQELQTWSVSLNMDGKVASETNCIGLYPVFVGNAPQLVTAWNTTGANWQSAKLNGLTNVWSSGAVGAVFDPSDANGGILNEVQHKNRIYFVDSNTTNLGWYDYFGDNFGLTGWDNQVRHPMDFVTFNEELWCLVKDDVLNINLHRINDDGSTQLLGLDIMNRAGPSGAGGIQVNSALSTANNFEGRNLLFVDNVRRDIDDKPIMWGINMAHGVIILGVHSKHGITFTAIVDDGTGTITGANLSTINASFLSNPFKFGAQQEGSGDDEFHISKVEETVFRCYIDQRERELGLISAIHCSSRVSMLCAGGDAFFGAAAGGGGNHNLLLNWQWLGGGSPGFPLKSWAGLASWDLGYGKSEATHRSFPHEKIGGGARSSVLLSDGTKNIDIAYRGTDTTDVEGIMRVFYSLITTPGVPNGTNVSIKWYYDENLHAPETQVAPTGTSDGVISGLEIVSLPADSGALYFFDWDVKAAGLAYGSRINLNGVVVTADSVTSALNDPTDLDGLELWLEADDASTITIGAGGVSEWRTKGGGSVTGLIQANSSQQPTLVPAANNGLDGVSFNAANSEFLFSSGSPVEHEPYTVFVIFEPASLGASQTIFSISDDSPFNTWDNGSAPSGTIVTDGEFYNVETNASDIILSSQDLRRTNEGTVPRDLPLDGVTLNDAKLVWWIEENFQSRANFHPGGALPDGLEQTVNINTAGQVIASGLVNSSGNTTVGRFTGAQISGVYGSAGKYFNGTIYEVATYNRTLFDLEIDRFILYASGKYNLA